MVRVTGDSGSWHYGVLACIKQANWIAGYANPTASPFPHLLASFLPLTVLPAIFGVPRLSHRIQTDGRTRTKVIDFIHHAELNAGDEPKPW
jgi:hypothetical protein